MKHLVLDPHVGIGPIKLGTMRSDVRSAMSGAGYGLDVEKASVDYFCDSSIQVEYQEDGAASFIGVSSNADILLTCEGVDLFDTEAKKAFAFLADRDQSGDHQFSEFEYVFPSQIITLYDAAAQYDHRRRQTRPVWGQIGCGNQQYLSAILKIRKGVLNPERRKRK